MIKVNGKTVTRRTVALEVSGLVVATLVLIVSLAWNETANQTFDAFFPGKKGILPFFLYALLMTIITVIVSVILLDRNKDKPGNGEFIESVTRNLDPTQIRSLHNPFIPKEHAFGVGVTD